MEHREVIVEDYDRTAKVLVVPAEETSKYLSEIKLAPDGGGINRRDYEFFVVTRLVANYDELAGELFYSGKSLQAHYFQRNLARAVYNVNEGFEPSQVLVRNQKCISRHDAVWETEKDALVEVLNEPNELDEYLTEREPLVEVLNETFDWCDCEPNFGNRSPR